MLNNGHAYSANFAGLGTGGIIYDDQFYDLIAINLHSDSEHIIAKRQFPLEVHFVHKNAAGDGLAVVAITLEKQISASQILTKHISPGVAFLKHLLRNDLPRPHAKASVSVTDVDPLDLNSLLVDGTFFQYEGSMTSPPCNQNTVWFVRREPLEALASQVERIHDAIYRITNENGNYRYVFPMGNRHTRILSAQFETGGRKTNYESDAGKHPHDNYATLKSAQDALTVAKTAADYVDDLDERIIHAANAHAVVVQTEDGNDSVAPHVEAGELTSGFADSANLKEVSEASSSAADSIGTVARHNLARMNDYLYGVAQNAAADSINSSPTKEEDPSPAVPLTPAFGGSLQPISVQDPKSRQFVYGAIKLPNPLADLTVP